MERPSEIDFNFPGRVRVPRVSLAYQLGLLIVSVAMLLLPLIYVGLIAVVAYGVCYHLAHNLRMLGGSPGVFGLVAYATPAIAGGVLVLFMVKPLFARRNEESAERTLRRDQEPVLFLFVERICRAVGAPFPERIQVNSMINASAGRHLGLVTGDRSGLTLTIGLPLAGGLTLRQFAGVLAHEFGHFSQGAGMRLSQAIRRVNHWFFRVVYERDHWDRELGEWSESRSGYVIFIVGCSRLGVWLSRRLLQLLMMAGHVISCFLMRQMEFHADAYEARLVGGSTFASTVRRLRVLEAASRTAWEELSRSWSEGWLADDLPALIVAHAERLPTEARRAALQSIDSVKTRLFDTHPADLDRMTRVAEETGAGAIPVDGPATVLFRDFGELSRGVTRDHYSRVLGERLNEENLVPVSKILERSAASREKQEAGARYFRGLLSATRPLFLDPHEPGAAGRETALQRLIDARRSFDDAARSGAEACRSYERAEKMRLLALQAERLVAAGIRIDAKSFDLPSGDQQGVARARARSEALMRESLGALEPAEMALRERLMAAFAALRQPSLSDRLAEGLRHSARSEALIETLVAMRGALTDVQEMRDAHAWLSALVLSARRPEVSAKIADDFESGARRLLEPLSRVRSSLESARYPFEHGGGTVSIGRALLAEIPTIREVGALWSATSVLLEGYFGLYLRVMTELGAIAEDVERAAGLET